MDFTQVCDQSFDFASGNFNDLILITINQNALKNLKEIKDRNKKTLEYMRNTKDKPIARAILYNEKEAEHQAMLMKQTKAAIRRKYKDEQAKNKKDIIDVTEYAK